MKAKKLFIFTFAKYLLFTLIPVIYISVYCLYDTYSINKMNNAEYQNSYFPIVTRAFIICLFTLLLLEIGKTIKNIVFCSLVIIVHLMLCILFSIYPSYFTYIEVLSSLILVAVFIPVDHILESKEST